MKLDIQPIQNYWEDDNKLDIQPLDIEPMEEAGILEQGLTALKQNVIASPLNRLNRASSGILGAIADLAGNTKRRDQIYADMEREVEAVNKWANPNKVKVNDAIDLASMVPSIPGQLLTWPLSPFETGQEMTKSGEKLSTSLAGIGIDSAGNAVGMLPGVGGFGKSVSKKIITGGLANAAQSYATGKAISGISETEENRNRFDPTLSSVFKAGVMGAAGAGWSARGSNKKAPAASPKKDITGAVQAEKARVVETTAGRLGQELPGEIDPQYLAQRRAQEEALNTTVPRPEGLDAAQRNQAFLEEAAARRAENAKAEQARQAEAQQLVQMLQEAEQQKRQLQVQERDAIFARLDQLQQESKAQVEAEQFAASKEPVVDNTGLSVGENAPGSGLETSRAPVTDSGLMGIPTKPQEPVGIPEALRTGEGGISNTVNRPSPFGEPPIPEQPRIDPSLAAGEFGVANPAPNVKPAEVRQNLDPFAGAAGPGNKRINKFGQGGAAPMFTDLAEGIVNLGKGIRAKFTGEKTPQPDDINTPRSQETIAAKNERARKARAIGADDDVYHRVTTIEEAISNPGKDISKYQAFASGPEGVLRRNTTNKPVNFVRTMSAVARRNTDALVRRYITGENGLNKKLRSISKEEWTEVNDLITELSQQKVNYSKELADSLDLSPRVRAFMEQRAATFDQIKSLMDQYNGKHGFKTVDSLDGYAPGLFSSQYAAPVYETKRGANGREYTTIVGVANGRSLGEFNQAKKYYQDKGYTVADVKRRGLPTQKGFAREFDGTLELLSQMAELDPRFKELQEGLKVMQREGSKKLYGLNVHEMKKKGVSGSIGEKPWRSAEQNAKERLEAEINFMDQAFKYWSYQDFITDAKSLVDRPELANMPGTREYVNNYVKHVTGVNLNPLGAAANSIVDTAFKVAGQGVSKLPIGEFRNMPENPNKVASVVRDTFSAITMNVFAPVFAMVNLMQPFQSGLPEAMRIRAATGLDASDITNSMMRGTMARSVLASMPLMEKMGVDTSKFNIPQHLRDAHAYLKEHAIESYNEAQTSHEGAQNPRLTKAKELAFWPTIIPEALTRPVVFMWFADMFHRAGYEDFLQRADNASEHAMVGYHQDQRPMLYQGLGSYGTMSGQLKTYGHNQIENIIARTKEAKKYPAAFTAMMGIAVGLGGITGLPGFDALDEWIVIPLTGKSARRHMQEISPYLLDGILSAYTGLDWQSRFSMAGTIPTSLKDFATPAGSKMFDIIKSGWEAGTVGDTASFNELAKAVVPSGLYGAYENSQLTTPDGYVLDKEGQTKYDQPRTERERNRRAVFGLRPLRERLEDQDLYARNKFEAKLTDKQKEQYRRMTAAINFSDIEGFNQAYDKYKEVGGDPTIIQDLFEKNAVNALKSARERAAGTPGQSIKSIEKYNRYWED